MGLPRTSWQRIGGDRSGAAEWRSGWSRTRCTWGKWTAIWGGWGLETRRGVSRWAAGLFAADFSVSVEFLSMLFGCWSTLWQLWLVHECLWLMVSLCSSVCAALPGRVRRVTTPCAREGAWKQRAHFRNIRLLNLLFDTWWYLRSWGTWCQMIQVQFAVIFCATSLLQTDSLAYV